MIIPFYPNTMNAPTPQSYQDLDEATALLALWYVVNTSLSAFYKLYKHAGSAKSALSEPVSTWQALSIHAAHVGRVADVADVLAFVGRVGEQVAQGAYGVLTLLDDDYPDALHELYDPPPVLFYRGNVARLSDPQIAIVGSRKPTPHAQKITFDMAQYLVHQGLTITSGLAGGVDRQAHLGALASADKGRTVGVMGTGVDVYYPKNHHALYAQIIQDGGCLISELLPATPASKHTFPRRNRLVAGLSLATLVTEATLQSGSLITARLTNEQGKQVFAIPSLIDNANAEGCHHLIREGATLVYHPEQIMEDIGLISSATKPPSPTPVSAFNTKPNTQANPSQNQTTSTPQTTPKKTPNISPHLQGLFDTLSDTPNDLDSLVSLTGQDVGELLAGLLELEMLGVIAVQGGRYVRV